MWLIIRNERDREAVYFDENGWVQRQRLRFHGYYKRKGRFFPECEITSSIEIFDHINETNHKFVDNFNFKDKIKRDYRKYTRFYLHRIKLVNTWCDFKLLHRVKQVNTLCGLEFNT